MPEHTTASKLACSAGVSDDNAKVQAAAVNILNLSLTQPALPVPLPAALVSFSCSVLQLCSAVLHAHFGPDQVQGFVTAVMAFCNCLDDCYMNLGLPLCCLAHFDVGAYFNWLLLLP